MKSNPRPQARHQVTFLNLLLTLEVSQNKSGQVLYDLDLAWLTQNKLGQVSYDLDLARLRNYLVWLRNTWPDLYQSLEVFSPQQYSLI